MIRAGVKKKMKVLRYFLLVILSPIFFIYELCYRYVLFLKTWYKNIFNSEGKNE